MLATIKRGVLRVPRPESWSRRPSHAARVDQWVMCLMLTPVRPTVAISVQL